MEDADNRRGLTWIYLHLDKVPRRYGANSILAERLWKTVKYEEVHPKAYANAAIARRELGACFWFCNNQWP